MFIFILYIFDNMNRTLDNDIFDHYNSIQIWSNESFSKVFSLCGLNVEHECVTWYVIQFIILVCQKLSVNLKYVDHAVFDIYCTYFGFVKKCITIMTTDFNIFKLMDFIIKTEKYFVITIHNL